VSFEAWLAFCVTETLLCLTPGPAVLFVVSVSLARGFRPGMAGALGILTTNALYFALSATGIAAVLLASNGSSRR
jgi:threonine/homoserine/homoserine lactone efflux protein